MTRFPFLRFTNWKIGTKVNEEDPNYKEVERTYLRQWTFKPSDTGFAALLKQYEAIGRSMSNVSSTFDKEFNNLANGADMFKDCWIRDSTQSAVNSYCTTSNQLRQSYDNSCCSIRSNAASIREVEEVQKNISELDFEVNKMQKEINEKLNWQATCLYLTWAMIIVIGFMICFKSFDVSVEVNNPIQNQEVILEHEK